MPRESHFLGANWRPTNYAAPLTTPEQRTEITRRYEEGESTRAIALSMGLRASTVRNYCRPRPKY